MNRRAGSASASSGVQSSLSAGASSQQFEHELGLYRGKAASSCKYRYFHDATGSIPEISLENRAEQTIVAGAVAAFGGDIANLPADHAVIPATDGQILHLIGGDQIVRDCTGEIRKRTAIAACFHKSAGNLVQRGWRLRLAALVVAQVTLLVTLLHCPSTVL